MTRCYARVWQRDRSVRAVGAFIPLSFPPAGIVTLTSRRRYEAEGASCYVDRHACWAHVSWCQILKAPDRIAR